MGADHSAQPQARWHRQTIVIQMRLPTILTQSSTYIIGRTPIQRSARGRDPPGPGGQAAGERVGSARLHVPATERWYAHQTQTPPQWPGEDTRGKVSQHQGHHVCRRPHPIERRADRGRQGPPTGATAIALSLLAMNADVPSPTLSSISTGQVVTELLLWVHWQSP